MRNLICFLAAALIAGGAACKKTDSEKAATELRKAKEAVQDEAKDVNKQIEDVTKETKDVVKENQELADAERRLQQARVDLTTSVKSRLALIDSNLAILDQRIDPVSKKLAQDLRMRRDMVSDRANAADSIAITNWDVFKSDIEDQMKVLETDLDKALHDDEKTPNP